MKISILTENTVYKRGFIGEHGLSLLIETKGRKFLFDTGQTRVFARNAEILKEELTRLDGIILSHGHYDHCGGLGNWLEEEQKGVSCPIYVNERAFEKKYTKNPKNNQMRYIGIDWSPELCGEQLKLIRESKQQIAENVFLLSQIPYRVSFEPAPGLFYQDEAGTIADSMADEQLMVIREEKGLLVFAGCAHPGIINCLSYVRESFSGEHIYGIFAGMHLKNCPRERLELTIQELKKINAEVVVPMHCTGILGIAAIKEQLGDNCVLAEAGKVINV